VLAVVAEAGHVGVEVQRQQLREDAGPKRALVALVLAAPLVESLAAERLRAVLDGFARALCQLVRRGARPSSIARANSFAFDRP
jgi:hypothetical protein